MKNTSFTSCVLLTLAAMLALFITACGQPVEPEGNSVSSIGVFDLRRVLTELELEQELGERIRAKESSLSERVEAQRNRLQNMLQSRREGMAEELTSEEIEELTQFEARATQQLQELIRRSEVELNQYQQQLLNEFNQRLRPVVEDISRDSNMEIILLKRNVFSITNEDLDITERIIEVIENDPDLRQSLISEIEGEE